MSAAVALHDQPDDALHADIVIAGTGPAGAVLARALSGTGLRVLLLESGGLTRDQAADGLNEVETIGRARRAPQWLVRNRILGGTSHTWSGRCAPFDETDLNTRPWVANSGWPFGTAELAPYLAQAAPYLGIVAGAGIVAPDSGQWPRLPNLGFDPDVLVPYLWAFSRDRTSAREHTRFGWHLAGDIGANVTLITHASLCDIELNEACSALRAVHIAGPDGRRRRVRTGKLVLACGGIENARLLLNADRQMPCGIGNQNDQVGRYLMDHLRGATAQFGVKGTAPLQRRFGHYRLAGGHVVAFGLQLSAVRQAEEGLLNAAAWLEGRIAQDDPWNALKEIAKGRLSSVPALIRNAALLPYGFAERMVARRGLPRKLDRLELMCMCEQLPDPESRITLSPSRDALGLRRARIDWRVHEQEALTLRRMTALVTDSFRQQGLPAPQMEDWVADHAVPPAHLLDVAHPSGTTRAGRDPRRSVVDEHGQVHGVDGLYVAGSSVFPTSGHANPTLMIVALALRLADRLKGRSCQVAHTEVENPAYG